MNESRQEVFNSGSGAVNPEKVINVEVSNIPANTDGLQVHRVDAVDTVQEGYGRVRSSGGSIRVSPYQKMNSDCQT